MKHYLKTPKAFDQAIIIDDKNNLKLSFTNSFCGYYY